MFPARPRTQKAIRGVGISLNTRVRMIEPVSCLDMLVLQKHAWLILADSGGVQKEAYFFGVPCFTLRNETEWVETVEAGRNVLVGADPDRIEEAVKGFRPRGERPAIFGDDRASQRIATILTGATS